MKKLSVVLVSSLLLLNLCACQNNASLDNIDGSQQTENKNEVNSNGAITIDDVKKANVTDSSKFEYENVDGGISITDYDGDDEIVVIPEKIDGLDVVEIGENAFANNDEIKGVRLSERIVKIETNAFCNCTSLEVVVCNKDLITIGEYAFSNCTALYDIELNDKLQTLGYSCFSFTDALTEIYIPSNVLNIDTAFIKGFTNVTIITEAGSAAEQYAKDSGIKYEIR